MNLLNRWMQWGSLRMQRETTRSLKFGPAPGKRFILFRWISESFVEICLHEAVYSLILFVVGFFLFCFGVFQAPTAEVKTTWVNEIRKVLTTQLEACRGAERTLLQHSVYICSETQALKPINLLNVCPFYAFVLSVRSQPAEGTRPSLSVSPGANRYSESQVSFVPLHHIYSLS